MNDMPNWLNVIFKFFPRTFHGFFAAAGVMFVLIGLIYNQTQQLLLALLNLNVGDSDAFIFFGILFIVIAVIIYIFQYQNDYDNDY